jgi:hypothetical protein
MIKNLIYHIWPVKGRGVWQWNVKQLLRRMDQFNGQRIVGIATDDQTDSAEAVKAAFKGTVTHFVECSNDRSLGEVATFPEMMRRIDNIDPRQIAFYAHAKGVKYPIGAAPMVRRWTRTMYANMLDYPPTIEDALKRNAMVGTFKKSGNAFGTLPRSWHYAGTFFWFRNADVFSQPTWHHIPLQWWGTEAWPGVVCPPDKAACNLLEGDCQSLQLYKSSIWTGAVDEAWKQWRIKESPLLRRQSYREILNSLTTRRIIVTGPQRSGTTVASKALAADLRIPFVPETEFDTHDEGRFREILSTRKEFVIQAPTMSPYVHKMRDCEVVWMRRDLADVHRSQSRIAWVGEQEERDRYFDHSKDPIAMVKTRAWDLFQRSELEESAFDMDYESLRGHRLWVDADSRTNFESRQTYR